MRLVDNKAGGFDNNRHDPLCLEVSEALIHTLKC